MAEKFPALNDQEVPGSVATDDVGGSDFLSREKELVGDEFKTEQDKDVWAGSDDEVNEFNEQFPEVDSQPPAPWSSESQEEKEPQEDDNFSQTPVDVSDSVHLREWKERRDLEISEREKANKVTKESIVSKARQTVDDFYENYNTKKETHSAEALKEQEAFLEKRDGFLKRGTLWDRVNELVNDVGEVSISEDRDKSRFKRLLKNLKGKENVPGAGGYD